MDSNVWIALSAYLVGSIPSAYIFVRLFSGRDVRYEGNRNVGARNAARLGGRKAGLLTALNDTLKGVLVWYICQRWGSSQVSFWLGGAALLLGHAFPVWLGFRGGKGLGVLGGFLAPLFPLSLLFATLVAAALYRRRATIRVLNIAPPLLFVTATVVERQSLTWTGLALALGALSGLKSLLDHALLRRKGGDAGWAERPQDGPVWQARPSTPDVTVEADQSTDASAAS